MQVGWCIVTVRDDSIAMLVVSCDRYSDLWSPFFTLLDRYWPDRTLHVYLMTNNLDFGWPGVTVIKVGEDVSYADNLRAALESIPEKWVLLWLEDLLLCSRVDQRRAMSILGAAQRRDAGYLKVSPDMPLSFEAGGTEEIGPVPKGVRYRSAIGASFYKRSTLLKLLVPGASAWDLDKSKLCDALPDEFFALTTRGANPPPIPHVNALIKGRWTRGAMSFLKSEGLAESLVGRRAESISSMLYRRAFVFRLELMKRLRMHWR